MAEWEGFSPAFAKATAGQARGPDGCATTLRFKEMGGFSAMLRIAVVGLSCIVVPYLSRVLTLPCSNRCTMAEWEGFEPSIPKRV